MKQSQWDLYNNLPDPARQACIHEWQDWLAEVENTTERQRLDSNLRSSEAYKHFSARLELYFHQLFASQGYMPTFHPQLMDRRGHVDLRVPHDLGHFYLEAKIRQEEAFLVQQEEFCEGLKTELRKTVLPYIINVNFEGEDCPKLEWLPEIVAFIKSQLESLDKGGEPEKEVAWIKSAYGTHYELPFSMRRHPGLALPSVNCGWVGVSDMPRLLYDSISQKASKYGALNLPFVIGIWGLDYPDVTVETRALYGADAFRCERDRDGNPIPESEREFRQPDGIFTMVEGGQRKHTKVSAVVFYQHRLADEGGQHSLRVYHNLYATKPLPKEIFKGFPQHVPVRTDDSIKMKWLNGPPADD